MQLRKSVIIAAFFGALDGFYRLVIVPELQGTEPDIRRLMLFGTFIVILGFLGFVPPAVPIVDLFAFMLIIIILLNDGSDFLSGVGAL